MRTGARVQAPVPSLRSPADSRVRAESHRHFRFGRSSPPVAFHRRQGPTEGRAGRSTCCGNRIPPEPAAFNSKASLRSGAMSPSHPGCAFGDRPSPVAPWKISRRLGSRRRTRIRFETCGLECGVPHFRRSRRLRYSSSSLEIFRAFAGRPSGPEPVAIARSRRLAPGARRAAPPEGAAPPDFAPDESAGPDDHSPPPPPPHNARTALSLVPAPPATPKVAAASNTPMRSFMLAPSNKPCATGPSAASRMKMRRPRA